jgi:hypothetical protein
MAGFHWNCLYQKRDRQARIFDQPEKGGYSRRSHTAPEMIRHAKRHRGRAAQRFSRRRAHIENNYGPKLLSLP